MKKLHLIFCFVWLAVSCGQNQAPYQEEVTKSEPAEPDQKISQNNDNQVVDNRKIIKMADILFQVKDLEQSTDKIQTLTQKYQGFISDMNQVSSSYSINNQMSIRIPTDSFDIFIDEVAKEAIYTNHKRIKSEDVSEEYVDISSRLKTKKEVRDRYTEILRDKANTVEEILEAEEKIRIIQEEIEAIEGRLRYLNDKVSVSTVHLEIYQEVHSQEIPKVYQKSFWDKWMENFKTGWIFILDTILSLTMIWPIIFFFVLVFVFRNKIIKLFKGKNK